MSPRQHIRMLPIFLLQWYCLCCVMIHPSLEGGLTYSTLMQHQCANYAREDITLTEPSKNIVIYYLFFKIPNQL